MPLHNAATVVVHRCTLKRRKLGLGGQIPVDFKACTMRCGSDVVQIMDEGSSPTG